MAFVELTTCKAGFVKEVGDVPNRTTAPSWTVPKFDPLMVTLVVPEPASTAGGSSEEMTGTAKPAMAVKLTLLLDPPFALTTTGTVWVGRPGGTVTTSVVAVPLTTVALTPLKVT